MPTAHDPLPVDCRSGALRDVRADLLCAPVFEDDDNDHLRELDTATAGATASAKPMACRLA